MTGGKGVAGFDIKVHSMVYIKVYHSVTGLVCKRRHMQSDRFTSGLRIGPAKLWLLGQCY